MADLATRETAELLTELHHRTRRAWDGYRSALGDLTGREYERAERDRWAELQAELRDIERDRADLQQMVAEDQAAA